MNITPAPVQQLPTAESVTNADHILIYRDADGKAYLAAGTLFRGDPGQNATINGETAITISGGDNISLSQEGGTLTVSSTLRGAYQVKGSATLATLPALTAANEGFVYDMSEAFTTTADFREGAGKAYPAGTNVVVASVGSNAYKYDVLSGFVDLSGYVQTTRQINGHALSADVTLDKSDVGLGNVDNTSDLNKPVSTATQAALNNKVDKDGAKVLSDNNYTTAEKNAVATIGDKVDKVTGKGLSTNDYTTAEKNDLAAIKALLQNAVFYRTASGNPAIFQDGYAENLRKLSVTLTPSQSGSGDPSPSNVRPISGVSSATVTRTGKNLFDAEYASGTVPASAVTISNGAIAINYAGQPNDTLDLTLKILPAPPGTRLVLSGASAQVAIRAISSGWSTIAEVVGDRSAEFTLPDDGKVRIRAYVSAVTNTTIYPMIRFASDTDQRFEPYRGSQSVAISLVDSNSDPLTVYGGTLDVTAGTLTVTWANIASYNGETLPGVWISDRDVYAAGTTPTTGAQVVYELASPVTYTLAAQQLAALPGYNAVSADAGSVSVEYRADAEITLGGS